MKLTSIILSVFTLFILTGCGNRSNYVNNEVLGKFPSIYVEYGKEKSQIKDDMAAEAQKAKDSKDMIKLRDKYVAKEKEAQQRLQEMATAELEKIADRQVPFRFDYEETDFEVRSAIIENGAPETGALSINLVIAARKAMKPSMNAFLHYIIMGTDGKYITKGRINPFIAIQTVVSSQFKGLPSVAEGDICCWQGSLLMLYCGSYDFTGFEQIVFINKASYNALK